MTEAMEQLAAEEGLDLEENEGDRFKVRDRIHPHIEQWCQTRTLEEVRQVWDDLGVCWGPYQTFKELVNQDKRVSETNPMFSTINQPGIGSYLSPKSPLNFQSTLQSEPLVAPLLGEHTEEILGGTLNLSENEIGKLYDNKIIKGLSN